jgi:hypothetical protein
MSADLARPAAAAVNNRQLRWAGVFVSAMQAAAAAREEAAAAAAATTAGAPAMPAQALGAGQATPIKQAPPAAGQPPPAPASPQAPPRPVAAAASRPQARALGVFGRVWDFLIDEAAFVESAEGEPAG